MNISKYVKKHWTTLPKSTFDGTECVVIKEIENDDWGYGHHSYEGYAVDQIGNLLWCYSSGCSCNGSCGADHTKDAKVYDVEWPDEFASIDPKKLDFKALAVSFSSY